MNITGHNLHEYLLIVHKQVHMLKFYFLKKSGPDPVRSSVNGALMDILSLQ